MITKQMINQQKIINNKKIKIIEENIKKYGEATLYLFDYQGFQRGIKNNRNYRNIDYVFNSNNIIKSIHIDIFSVYQDIRTKMWFGDFEGLNVLYFNTTQLINGIKAFCRYGINKEQDAEMRQVFKQIRSKIKKGEIITNLKRYIEEETE